MAGRLSLLLSGTLRKTPREALMHGKDGTWQYAVDPVHYDKERAGAGLGRASRWNW